MKNLKTICLGIMLSTLMLMSAGAQDSNTGVVRAIWTPDAMAIINISDVGVNLSTLSLESATGSIEPTDWVMLTDESGVSYSLADVRPGSCLLIYLADSMETEPPAGANCTRVVAEFTPVNVTDIVWDVTQGGFNPFVDGSPGDVCSVSTGTSCDISVPTGGEDMTLLDAEITPVRAIWTQDVLVLINTGQSGADFSALTLTGNEGVITPDMWVMNTNINNVPYQLSNIRPGGCLVSYLSITENTQLPEGVECNRIVSITTLENQGDAVWIVETGGFSADVNGESVICQVRGTTVCDFSVPNADAAKSSDVAEADIRAEPTVRAIWNEDVFVVINISSEGVDLSSTDFVGTTGALNASNWVLDDSFTLDDVRPGSCLVTYLSTAESTELPAGVDCTRIMGETPLENIEDVIWNVTVGPFTANGVSCETVGTTTCDIPVPSSGR